MRWDFPQCQELRSKSELAAEFYATEKLLFLICTVHWQSVSGPTEAHAMFFITAGDQSKSQSLIQHCIALAVTWCKRRGGVTHFVHSSDRSTQEFSNAINMYHLSQHTKKHGTTGEWVFSMENEGKGANDALGLAVVALLKSAVAASEKIRNNSDAARILHRRTQGKPVRGKYSVYTQYVFMAMHPGDIKNVPRARTTNGFTKHYHWKCDRPGVLAYRRAPCWCKRCLRGDNDMCTQTSYTGFWTEVKTSLRSGNTQQYHISSGLGGSNSSAFV